MRFSAYFTVFATSMYMAAASDTLSQVDTYSNAPTVTDLFTVADAHAMAVAEEGKEGATVSTSSQPEPKKDTGKPAAKKKAESEE